MIENYFGYVQAGLSELLEDEKERMGLAAQLIADMIECNGILHIFGCGHSHMLAEEAFYRAGGLVPVSPILVEPLMLHEGAVRSSKLEKTDDYGTRIIDDYAFHKNDIVWIVSTSGRNPVPIDVALGAKEQGCHTIALTSFAYESLPSRHKSGQRLAETVDLAINNHVALGDAVMRHERVRVPFSPVSSIYNSAVLNAVFAQAISLVAERGNEPPIFLSENIDHASEHNIRLIESYQHKIPLLRKPME